MPEIKFSSVISCSSEDKVYKANNLLRSDGIYKWKCAEPGEKQAVVLLELQKQEKINELHVGNEGSAFVEILVSKSAASAAEPEYQVLLAAHSFMSPAESKQMAQMNRVRIFGNDQLATPARDLKWDRLKIVCTQPFNPSIQYGLSFIKIFSSPESTQAGTGNQLGLFRVRPADEASAAIAPGSLFQKRGTSASSLSAATSPPIAPSSVPSAASPAIQSQSQSQNEAAGADGSSNAARARRLPAWMQQQGAPPANPQKAAPANANAGHSPAPSKRARTQRTGAAISGEAASNAPAANPAPAGKRVSTERTSADEKPVRNKNAGQSVNSQTPTRAAPTPAGADNGPAGAGRERRPRGGGDVRGGSPAAPKAEADEKGGAKAKATDEKRSAKATDAGAGAVPFERLMAGVVFALSGYENPLRARIRDCALAMGAQYRTDWTTGCTHLICAFANTPKYQKVAGKGRIVNAQWISDCYSQKKLLPWRKYRMGRAPSPPGTEDESGSAGATRRGTQRVNYAESEASSAADSRSAEEDEEPSRTHGAGRGRGPRAGGGRAGDSGNALDSDEEEALMGRRRGAGAAARDGGGKRDDPDFNPNASEESEEPVDYEDEDDADHDDGDGDNDDEKERAASEGDDDDESEEDNGRAGGKRKKRTPAKKGAKKAKVSPLKDAAEPERRTPSPTARPASSTSINSTPTHTALPTRSSLKTTSAALSQQSPTAARGGASTSASSSSPSKAQTQTHADSILPTTLPLDADADDAAKEPPRATTPPPPLLGRTRSSRNQPQSPSASASATSPQLPARGASRQSSGGLSSPRSPRSLVASLPDIPSFFSNLHFFLDQSLSADDCKELEQIILTFNGNLVKHANDELATHVVAAESATSKQSSRADEHLAGNTLVVRVSPDWLRECARRQALLPVGARTMPASASAAGNADERKEQQAERTPSRSSTRRSSSRLS